jgi:hypothetical protein
MGKKILVLLYFLFFIFHFLLAQSWLWGAEGIGDGYFESMTSDRKGNCYITGLFQNDTIHFGTYTVLNSTYTNYPYSSDGDAFLVKYAPDGTVLWAKQTFEKNVNPLANDAPESVCTDDAENVYLAGNFIDTLFIGSNMLITRNVGYNPQSMYLAKYDSNGNVLWTKQAICMSDSSIINADHISSDGNGNIYVAGEFWDSVRLGTILLVAPPLLFRTFLAKYDSSGNVKWAKSSTGNTLYGAVSFYDATDREGNTFITGNFEDTVIFGSVKLSAIASQAYRNCFIAKYDSAGNVLWAKNPSIPSPESGCVGFALTTDLNGNVYLGGDFIDTLVFDQDTIIGPINSSVSFFLVKYSLNGNVIWTKCAKILDANSWNIWGLSTDNANHVYFSANGGAHYCKVVFGGDTLSMYDTAKNDQASVIFKLDSNGKVLCSSIIPIGTANGNFNDIVSDTSGKYVYVSGTASSVAIFGNDTIDPFAYPVNPIQRGNYFPFVARWNACDTDLSATVIPNKNSISHLLLYPNPNTGIFTIALQNVNNPAQVEIYNVLGEEVCQVKLNSCSTQINLGSQSEGIYFYRASTETGELIGSGKICISR